jgi:hypothetical protein
VLQSGRVAVTPLRFAQSAEMVKVLMEHDGQASAAIYRQLKAMTAHMVAVECGISKSSPSPMDCITR